MGRHLGIFGQRCYVGSFAGGNGVSGGGGVKVSPISHQTAAERRPSPLPLHMVADAVGVGSVIQVSLERVDHPDRHFMLL